MGRLLLLGIFLFIQNGFAADIHHHDLIEYPAAGKCAATATELADRFKAAAGVEIYWAGITAESSTGCNVRISYIAPERIAIASTLDRYSSHSLYAGTKRSLAECQADLPREAALFSKSTGIEPWISYCYAETNIIRELPFVPVVQGIGAPTNTFFISSTKVGITPNEGWAKLLPQIWQNATNLGIATASIVSRPSVSASDKEITLRFYARARGYLQVDGAASHSDPAICEQQIESVRAGLAASSQPPLAVYCGKYFNKLYQLGILTLSADILKPAVIPFTEDPKQFGSLESCRADLPSTLNFYAEKLGKKVLTGMCANAHGRFQITVMQDRKFAR